MYRALTCCRYYKCPVCLRVRVVYGRLHEKLDEPEEALCEHCRPHKVWDEDEWREMKEEERQRRDDREEFDRHMERTGGYFE